MDGQITSKYDMTRHSLASLFFRYRFSLIVPLLLLIGALVVFPWDKTLTQVIRDTPLDSNSVLNSVRMFAGYFRGFGKGEVTVLLALLIGWCGYQERAIAIICALIISGMLVWPLKITVQRERPRGNNFVSFPSGDAASAASFARVVSSGAPVLIPIAAVMSVSVSAGRVFDYAHYASDVLTGTALGIIAGILGLELSRRFPFRIRERYYFMPFCAFVVGNIAYCTVSGTQNNISRFLDIFGPVIGLVVVVRCGILYSRRRNLSAN